MRSLLKVEVDVGPESVLCDWSVTDMPSDARIGRTRGSELDMRPTTIEGAAVEDFVMETWLLWGVMLGVFSRLFWRALSAECASGWRW